jgi:lauroyl/myristoyl acyltransferase
VFKRLLVAGFVVYVYCLHLPALRLLGPRGAVLASRLFAFLHWLLVVAGGNLGKERNALRRMQELLPRIHPGVSPRLTLLRSLALKHQVFVEYALCSTRRGRRYVERTYHFEGREHLDAAVKAAKGVIVLPFHFGMAFTVFPALKIFGYELLVHLGRAVTYLENTFEWARRLAVKGNKKTDSCQGQILYHYPNYVFPTLARRLRRGGLVGMTADGMGSTDFLDVPFLGGTTRMPTGPAQLSALTGALIVCVYVLPDGLYGHRIVVHPPVCCPENSPQAIQATTAGFAELLGNYVRERPWAWLPWRQLEVAANDDGTLAMNIRPALPAQRSSVYDPFHPAAQANGGAASATADSAST